jgi:prepilin-type N-terminal cleavage/methylation domain-containing protein
MRRSKGFTVLELMIAVVLALVLGSALFMSLRQVQLLAGDLEGLMDRDENLKLAPALLAQWVSGAGNRRLVEAWPGISVDGAELACQSDFDGPEGFPDGKLAASYEDIRLEQGSDALRLRSGDGSPQPFLRRISEMSVSRKNDDLVSIGLTGSASLLSSDVEHLAIANLEIYLWNFRRNLFFEGE